MDNNNSMHKLQNNVGTSATVYLLSVYLYARGRHLHAYVIFTILITKTGNKLNI